MKAFLVTLLAAVLCMEPGGSLQCYTCKTKLKNSDCLTNTTCPTGSNVCKTDVISIVGLFNVINKACVASCSVEYQDFTVGKQNVSCCTTDLCNYNGVGRMGNGYTTMAAGLAASLFCTLLWNKL